jgi:hypothetical protein
MKLEFPKMIYKTKDDYKIVLNAVELEDAINKGFKLHWQDVVALNTKQIDAKIESLDKEIKAPRKKAKKWQQ